LGVGWSLLTPLVMLLIYALVFGVAFRGGAASKEHDGSFALTLFAGLMVHSFMAECLNRAPNLIVSQPNYVKKVVFPLEILPSVAVCSAGLQFVASLILLSLFCFFSGVQLHITVLLVPLVMLPIAIITLGLTLILSSLGVYLRDISQGIGVLTSATLFLSPVFYPISALPEKYRIILVLNPITTPIEQLRTVVLMGDNINWWEWSVSLLIGILVILIADRWFQKSRTGFADAL
jgi:lipopolysaccharide transport system permease protein